MSLGRTGNHRFKLKTGEYVRLHRIVTEFTPKRVWEALKDGDSLEFKNMPEEFEAWLQSTIDTFRADYDRILSKVEAEYRECVELSDKELGLTHGIQYKGLIFMLRKGKNIEQSIWKMVKPKNEGIEHA